jgi:diphthamide biosynthesis protein 2
VPPATTRAGPRFSLVGGAHLASEDEDRPRAAGGPPRDGEEGQEGDKPAADGASALALHTRRALQVAAAPGGRSDLVEPRSAADYLAHKRTWVGVEAPLAGAAPKEAAPAQEGRSGRAAGYRDERPPAAAGRG